MGRYFTLTPALSLRERGNCSVDGRVSMKMKIPWGDWGWVKETVRAYGKVEGKPNPKGTMTW